MIFGRVIHRIFQIFKIFMIKEGGVPSPPVCVRVWKTHRSRQSGCPKSWVSLCRSSNFQEPLIVQFNPDSESKGTGGSSKATKKHVLSSNRFYRKVLGNPTPTKLGRSLLGLIPETSQLCRIELGGLSMGWAPLTVEEESAPSGKGKAQEFSGWYSKVRRGAKVIMMKVRPVWFGMRPGPAEDAGLAR